MTPSMILYDRRVILYDSKCFITTSVGASTVPRHRQHMGLQDDPLRLQGDPLQHAVEHLQPKGSICYRTRVIL
jgi:hypothetical protein